MARLVSVVTIVTTDGPSGRAGFTASAICSVTDDPPTLLVCQNRASSAYSRLKNNGVLCVNVLNGQQERLSRLFSGAASHDERFQGIEWSVLTTGSPMLPEAVVSFDCRVTKSELIGTHDVLYCRVVAIKSSKVQDSLVYVGRRYCSTSDVNL
jgi:flavin reductase